MHKFFVDNKNISPNIVFIDGEDFHHISRVLRLKKKDRIIVSDGVFKEYLCEIDDYEKNRVLLNIIETYTNETEPPVKVVLFQGLPKSQKMDLIVQKCVEIGIFEIYPVETQRAVAKAEGKDKCERWNKISLEAAKQSKRGIIPKIHNPISFLDALKLMENYDLSLMPFEGEKAKGLKSILQGIKINSTAIFIGPEGGFEDSEVLECIKRGITPVTLGPRILRTETAGFAALSMILYEIGDMGGK